MGISTPTRQAFLGTLISLSNSKVGYPLNAFCRFLYTHGKKFDIRVEVDNHKMSLDLTGFFLHLFGGLGESLERRTLENEICEGDTVLDLGASIGFYTLIAAKRVGKKGTVFAFEPEPDNFARLEQNVSLNTYDNVVLENKAISDKSGTCKLYLSKEDAATHTIYDTHDGRQCIDIEAICLDDYFCSKIDFIKMDLEGAEWAALQGMSCILQNNKHIKLLTEFSPGALKLSGTKPKRYLEFLLEHGFELHVIDERKEKVVTATIDTIMSSMNPLGYVNLLCVR